MCRRGLKALLLDRSRVDVVLSAVVSRILQSTDQLYVDTQEAILRTPQLEVNDPELANDVVAAKFRDTLTKMDVLIPRCLLRTKLLEEQSKLQGM